MKENDVWLRSYATFCHLRDIYNTCNFNAWPKYKHYSEEIIDSLCNESYIGYKDIQFYYFLQYHADKQLLDVKLYARANGIALKGDLPIGIYRFSTDAWVNPELFNMNEQAGAPPDDYAVLGQNWGFPTYNWSVMSKDGFKWWRHRMQHLNRHFDALRIDHILGFFRIWQIPTNQVEGTMGSFNPRIPFSRDELKKYGISGDLSRYTNPHISLDILNDLFGSEVEDIINMFFNSSGDGTIVFKSSFDTQQEIVHFISQNPKFKKHEPALLSLISEVLIIIEPNSDGQLFNPRITIGTTTSYDHLNDSAKSSIDALYNDYYFKRHDEYWKEQALWKLPAILDSSDLLICGEDLGMIPKAVPGVMREMNIISLEIQRMPKGNTKFGQVAGYPYFSVCSPSCHDMSTIRGYWESDHENAKDYYYNYLHWYGLTPLECSPEIVTAIIEDHLMSPSILAIFPIQDIIGMDVILRKKDVFSEQINEPSNPKHYWRYRFHINVEDLIAQTDLNHKITSLIRKSGRYISPDYAQNNI
ncbi:MAG: 4-alpha-glucanotransferase [Saprospiraceae bacterium]|nr:4-alpha-glucanotransferase [Saprospiraceae bacterium]